VLLYALISALIRDEGAEHTNSAVREVEHTSRFIDEHDTEGGERVEGARGDPDECELEQ
jgi:hypothetical protein